MSMYAIFSKAGRWIGFSNSTPSEGAALYKEINEINPSDWVWEGSFEEGRLVKAEEALPPVQDKTIIIESDLQKQLYEKIDYVYPIQEQLVLIIQALHSLTKNKYEEDFKEFNTLGEYIHEELKYYNEDIKTYSSDENFKFIPLNQESEFIDEDARQVLNTEK